ncbi:hypothetical protein [Hymenobacter fodinae]|uniref:Uncharacterized protein n=1 Tax=Hymenobacter fodinae TaxID=2510796 RepID=A0A4Z0P329_9BACT|nr:hypothetical protein [Hymenobacter fodinae]TGE06103.1 hypothetical protein EU556_14645 [Hymenobacter fodinae]
MAKRKTYLNTKAAHRFLAELEQLKLQGMMCHPSGYKSFECAIQDDDDVFIAYHYGGAREDGVKSYRFIVIGNRDGTTVHDYIIVRGHVLGEKIEKLLGFKAGRSRFREEEEPSRAVSVAELLSVLPTHANVLRYKLNLLIAD